MRRVLLVGSPNVGKSVVFTRLTGVYVIASNYPGTTVEFTKGCMRVGDEQADVVDVPGTYSLEPSCAAEEVAVRMLDEMKGDDVVVNVIDATKLERGLNLALQVLSRRKPTVVALNFWDETKHTGITIDAPKLEAMLGVPCVPLVAVTGTGLKDLVGKIACARSSEQVFDDGRRWDEIGRIISAVQRVSHRHHTFWERLGDASVRPFPGLLVAAAVLFTAFAVVRFTGEGLIAYVFDPGFEGLWRPLMMRLSAILGSTGFLHQILVGDLVNGGVSFRESMGLLTTGLYVPFAMVMPYVFAFYLVVSFIEDTGYLPRLAVLLDGFMHRVGLHGMGVIPILLGFGCNVPGALATRIMETRRERFIAMTLIAVCTPCMAKTSMIVGLAGRYGASALVPIFLALFAAWLVIGFLLGRFLKGQSPEILVDIPPYRMPYLRHLAKKLGMRMLWFLREAVPWVLAGVLLVNILYSTGAIHLAGQAASPVIKGLLGLPENAVAALVVGFLRKDVAIGMLAPLDLDLRQTVVGCAVLAMFFPCVAMFAVMLRELGWRDTVRSTGIMVGAALAAGSILNLVLRVAGR